MRYRCQHCDNDLGEVIDGEPVPACHDHPHGGIDIVDDDMETEAEGAA
jgi:hypothetical protein